MKTRSKSKKNQKNADNIIDPELGPYLSSDEDK